MLLFLNGDRNRRGAINENYAPRADGAVHARRGPRRLHRGRRARARAGAHAAGAPTRSTSWAATTSATTTTAAGTPVEDGVRPDRRVQLGGRLPDWCSTHPMHASFFVAQAVGLLHPDAARAPRRRRALEQLYVELGHQIRPVARGDPLLARLLRGAAMVKPPVVLLAGMLRARAAHDRDLRSGTTSATAPASSCSTRPTSRAGTTCAGSTRTRRVGRWDLVSEVLAAERRSRAPRRHLPGARRRAGARRAPARSGATRRCRRDRRRAQGLRGRAPITGTTDARPAARAAPERAAPARRRLPRLPDLLRTRASTPATARTSPAPQ